MKTISTFTVSEKLIKKLKRISKKREQSLSSLVNNEIQKFLEEEEKNGNGKLL